MVAAGSKHMMQSTYTEPAAGLGLAFPDEPDFPHLNGYAPSYGELPLSELAWRATAA